MEVYLLITQAWGLVLWLLSEYFTDRKIQILHERIAALEAEAAKRSKTKREGSWPNGTLVIATVQPMEPLKGEN